ncbi:FARP2 protein, partial [Polypterus senegalus]
MGEIEGSYRVLQTPGSRLGVHPTTGVSTLEPGQSLSNTMTTSSHSHGKGLQVRVMALDDTQEEYDIETRTAAQTLLAEVFRRLSVVESDYFGLEHQTYQMNWVWLEPTKPILKQIRTEIGDFDEATDREHLKISKLLPKQDHLQEKIMEFHRRHLGQTPGESDFQVLEIARKLEMYGIRFHPAADREGTKINLAVAHMGLLVFQSMSFSECLRVPGSPSSATISYHSLHATSTYPHPHREHIQSSAPSQEDPKKDTSPPIHSFQGATSYLAAGDCSPTSVYIGSSIVNPVMGTRGSLIQVQPRVPQNVNYDNEQKEEVQESSAGGFFLTSEEFDAGKLLARQVPVFTLTNTQLQVTEEFIDDDPAEISFFGGGSEAFDYRYDRDPNHQSSLPEQHKGFEQSCLNQDDNTKMGAIQDKHFYNSKVHKFEKYYTNNCKFSFEEGCDLNGNATCDLFSMTGKRVCTSQSETSSLINNRSQCSSLDNIPLSGIGDSVSVNLPLNGTSDSASLKLPGSSNQSEASSMVNFPTYSVRSESSSAFQFSDIVEQLEQLSCPPTATEGSSSSSGSDSDSEWGSDIRYPTDKAYFIAKEILTTERTYLKDLEVITVWFRSAVIKENAMPEGLMTLLFSNIDPIYEFHRGFLKEIDQRLALCILMILAKFLFFNHTKQEFTSYLQKHDEVLTELEKATKRLKKLETVYKEFELQKVCYLPLNTFLLKPIQRLMHYKLILDRLCNHYAPDHRDYNDCKDALNVVAEMATQLQSSLIRLENFQKLTELQRDLIGIENLTAPGREFIREGCLYKLTKKGLQQRMFFLFSDMLLYTSKGVTATNQFKVHGQLPLHGMLVEEAENEWSVPHCFTIYSAQRTIVVAASSKVEMGKWIEDLNIAIEMVKKSHEKSELCLDSCPKDRSNSKYLVKDRSSDEVSLEQESEDDTHSSRSSLDKQTHHRANTTMHVCWHRNTSVSMSDHSLAVENQLSGYLLRKFKNSNGWQKLWVVFTNFCLFFYKTHQDDFPLASLPLLGYTVSTPTETDSIHKEYVFKLQFKSHVYFFRAESEYTFERWMEVIKSAASTTGRVSLLIQKETKEHNGN